MSQSTSADAREIKVPCEKKLDSAVITFDNSRIEKNPARTSPSTLPAMSDPISGVFCGMKPQQAR